MADQLLGSFVWCELLTTDMAGAESFYTKVVGWTAVPFAPDGSYKVFNNAAGAGSGGMMALPDAAKSMGAPPHWMMYLGTPDVDGTAMRVAQMGGRVLQEPADIPEVGRFAVVMDPYGASFALLQPASNGPQRGPVGAGDFSWFELYTPNPDGAWAFYSSLFGWEKTSAMDMGPDRGVYQMFGRGGGIPNGGIMKTPPGMAAGWLPYALVKDSSAAAAMATANGGTITVGPMEVPGGDSIAMAIDPQGAMFAVHSLKPTSAEATAGKPATQKAAAVVKATVKKVAKKVAKKVTKKVVKKVARAVVAAAAVAAAKKAKKAKKKAAAKKPLKKQVAKTKAKPVKQPSKPAKKHSPKKVAKRKAPKPSRKK